MSYSVNPAYILPDATPAAIPGLVACWDFQADDGATAFAPAAGEGADYLLQSQTGPLQVAAEPGAPLGGRALYLRQGDWLRIPRAACPLLDVHGPDGQVTVVAWIKRRPKSNRECEFIAGQWNETHRSRQYALFLNIGVWGTEDQLCGHLSHVGGPTPGYKYCIDGPMTANPVPHDAWSVVALSYDGREGRAWLNGVLDARPGLNPYSLAGGLNDGGPDGSDFTVGAVSRHGQIGNFFHGFLAGLAVYRRALTAAEIHLLARLP